MANNKFLSDIAKEVLSGNPILDGRTKIDSDKTVALFGQRGFTVAEISRNDITDKKTGEPKHYYYVAVKEDDTVIISSGQVFTTFLDRMIDRVGSIEEFNAACEVEEFILKPEFVKSKNGNKYMNVTVIS